MYALYYFSWSIFLSNCQSKLDRISEQLEPDEVEDDYFRYRICWARFAGNFFYKGDYELEGAFALANVYVLNVLGPDGSV